MTSTATWLTQRPCSLLSHSGGPQSAKTPRQTDTTPSVTRRRDTAVSSDPSLLPSKQRRTRNRRPQAMLWVSGCMMVGPNYVQPLAPTEDAWIETTDPAVRQAPADVSAWWTVFNDPVLNTLVGRTYRQNPSLRTAGVRVLEAQARRGIAIGQLFPQQQEALGNRRVTKSVRTARIGVRFSSGSSTIGKSGSTRPGNSTSGGASTAGLRLRTQNFLPQSRTTMMS